MEGGVGLEIEVVTFHWQHVTCPIGVKSTTGAQ